MKFWSLKSLRCVHCFLHWKLLKHIIKYIHLKWFSSVFLIIFINLDPIQMHLCTNVCVPMYNHLNLSHLDYGIFVHDDHLSLLRNHVDHPDLQCHLLVLQEINEINRIKNWKNDVPVYIVQEHVVFFFLLINKFKDTMFWSLSNINYWNINAILINFDIFLFPLNIHSIKI